MMPACDQHRFLFVVKPKVRRRLGRIVILGSVTAVAALVHDLKVKSVCRRHLLTELDRKGLSFKVVVRPLAVVSEKVAIDGIAGIEERAIHSGLLVPRLMASEFRG